MESSLHWPDMAGGQSMPRAVESPTCLSSAVLELGAVGKEPERLGASCRLQRVGRLCLSRLCLGFAPSDGPVGGLCHEGVATVLPTYGSREA